MEVQRVVDTNRNTQQRNANSDSVVHFTIQNNPGLEDIRGTLEKLLPIIHTSEYMCVVVSSPLTVAFSQPKNIYQHSCRAKPQEHKK